MEATAAGERLLIRRCRVRNWIQLQFFSLFQQQLLPPELHFLLQYAQNCLSAYLLIYYYLFIYLLIHTHPFNGPLSGTARVSRYQKGKQIWILLMQETVNGNGISWAICKSASCSRQITTPAPHHSVFLQARCPSCRPTNSV